MLKKVTLDAEKFEVAITPTEVNIANKGEDDISLTPQLIRLITAIQARLQDHQDLFDPSVERWDDEIECDDDDEYKPPKKPKKKGKKFPTFDEEDDE